MRLIDADALIDDAMDRYCKDCDKRKGIKDGKYRIIYEIGEAPCRACDVDDILCELENAPTVDIDAITESHEKIGYDKGFRDGYAQATSEVRQGHWKGKPIAGYSTVRCSECGEVFMENTGKWNYCPNCGAKMNEVEDVQ